MISALRNYFSQNAFIRNVAILVTGSSLAQFIPFLSAPLLTRLYIPSQFGEYGIYIATVNIIGLIGTLCYDQAIMLPRKIGAAINMLYFAVLTTILFCFFTGLILIILLLLNKVWGNIELKLWMFLLPIGVLLTGLYKILDAWQNRNKKYNAITFARISQPIVTFVLAVTLAKFAKLGLIFGFIGGYTFYCIFMLSSLFKNDKKYLPLFSFRHAIKQAKCYKNFPMFALPATFVNVALNQLPVILIVYLFGSQIGGYFSLNQRVLLVPLTVVGSSILYVFRQRASHDYANKKSCSDVFRSTLKLLLVFSIIPCLILFFFAPSLFSLIFGHSWIKAGGFARILCFSYLFRFIASPLSYTFIVADKLQFELFLEMILLVLMFLSLFLGYYLNNIDTALIFMSISYSVFYIIYTMFSYKFSKGTEHA